MSERPEHPEVESTAGGEDAPSIEHATDVSPEDERVARLLEHSIDVTVLAEAVEQQEAADAADTLEHLEDQEAAELLVAMDEHAAAEALAEMEMPLAEGVLEDLHAEGRIDYAALLLRLMAPDDAADLLQKVDEGQREQIFAEMPAADAVALRKLVAYDEDSAGGLMTTDFVSFLGSMTVAEATEVIRATSIPEEFNHVPVIDDAHQLVGMVGLRSLLLSRPMTHVRELLDPSARAIRVDLDQEAVAHEFDRYDVSLLPVVNEAGRLLGIVTVDDVIDIIREEQTEDVQKTVGAGAEEAVYSGLDEKLRGRLKWLVTSLFLTTGAAAVILLFEDLISEQPIVAVLMPVIAALVGNAGHQALAVTLRGIALDEVRRDRVWPLLLREAGVGLVNGAALGVLIFLLVGLTSLRFESASWGVGAVAGLALAVSMCAGTFAGSAIPLVMRRLGADPAQSSTIFLIMLTDATAFTTFLGLAQGVRAWVG